MALIAFAQPFLFGTPVVLNRKQLLRAIKSGKIGSSQYVWLHQSMKRLREATLFLEVRKQDGSFNYAVGKMVSFNILRDVSFDGGNETYMYTLDPRWVLMFGNHEYSLLDWRKRMQIRRGLDMAKTLQRLLATSADLFSALRWMISKHRCSTPALCGSFEKHSLQLARKLSDLESSARGGLRKAPKASRSLPCGDKQWHSVPQAVA